MSIELTDEPRFNAKPPRLSAKESLAFKKWFREAVDRGWIERSSSRHTCALLFAPKPDEPTELRTCINYVPLNRITKSRVYAPRADRWLRSAISGHTWYTKIDLKNAFYHMRLRDGDKWKAAFRTPHGVYQPTVPMFGLKNAPGEFQMWIEEILAEVLGDEVCVHIDDILVHTDEREECTRLTRTILSILERNNIEVNTKKSRFCVTEITYCGFIYKDNTCKPRDKSDTLMSWPEPNNVTQLRGFLGTTNQFADHVHRYGMMAEPLYTATGKTWVWSYAQSRAFQQLKLACATCMATAAHDPLQPCTLITDASQVGIAALLKQNGRVTAMWSRVLTPAERNYTTNERELLAVVDALRHWVIYLDTAPAILVKTDNMINATLLRPNQSNRRVNRWIADIQAYPLEWEHIAGEGNPADGPSRRSDYGQEDDAYKGRKIRKVRQKPLTPGPTQV